MNQITADKLLIPGAIVVAGMLIGAGVYFGAPVSSGGPAQVADSDSEEATFGNNNSDAAENVRPVGADDHVRGNPDAPVTLIEYSDFECPFCGRFHPTAERVLEEYEGQVKWVYRHFPLTSIHPSAREAAVASECAAELGGNDAFWTFADGLFENQSRLGEELYSELAGQAGLASSDLLACVAQERHVDRVEADFLNAGESGGRGTPYVIVVNADGEVFPFSGALPYPQVKSVIDKALES